MCGIEKKVVLEEKKKNAILEKYGSVAKTASKTDAGMCTVLSSVLRVCADKWRLRVFVLCFDERCVGIYICILLGIV